MTGLAILPLLIAISCSISTEFTAVANRVSDPELHYKKLWSEPIPPKSKRPMIGRYRIPVFSELHRYIMSIDRTYEDMILENRIKHRFIQAGMSKIPKIHFRISCRNGLCEYVFVFEKLLTVTQEHSALAMIATVSRASCKPKYCQSGAIIGGNNNSEISTLGYFIPNNSGLI